MWFKKKRKQCEKCYRTFYKPKVKLLVNGIDYHHMSSEMCKTLQVCPHCEHPHYITV